MVTKALRTRLERVRVLRVHLCMRRQQARHNMLVKGPFHFDTIYELDVLEELSAALHDELGKLKAEQEEEKDRELAFLEDGWDTTVMMKKFNL